MKDRSIEKLEIEYYNLLIYSWKQPACVIGQIKLLARPHTYTVTVTLLYRSAKVKYM